MTENKKTVDRYMDGFRKSDHAQVLSCLTDDVEWDMPGGFHLVGKDAFDKEVAEGTVRAGRMGGSFLNAVFCDAFTMQRGKIKRLVSYLVEIK